MSIVDKLASSLGRNDEVPNQELAASIAAKKDKAAVKELVALLSSKDKNIQSDCIKVLYELGELEPKLLSPHTEDLLKLLHNKNNRLVWGAMTALNTIVQEVPEQIYSNLEVMIKAADSGSVIAKDNLVNILIKLASVKQYKEHTTSLLMEQLWQSAPNQFPMYAERVLPIIDKDSKQDYEAMLRTRMHDMEKDSQKKRLEKILKKLNK
jgi:hypothetical protein